MGETARNKGNDAVRLRFFLFTSGKLGLYHKTLAKAIKNHPIKLFGYINKSEK
jgi:hypothetical protein